MSAADLFCSKEVWSKQIFRQHEWPRPGETVRQFTVSALADSVGITVGDADTPVVFGGFKVDPIAGNVALCVCLGPKWSHVARRIHEKFVKAVLQSVPDTSKKLMYFPSPLIDTEYVDMVMSDTRQPLSLLDAKGGTMSWEDLHAGDRIAATLHFGGFVSNEAVTSMFFSCSSIRRI